MPVPTYEIIMLPALRYLGDGKEHTLKDVVGAMSEKFSLSEEEKVQKLKSGQTVMYNRTAWALMYMSRARLLENPRRGVLQITERGMEIVRKNQILLNVAMLMQYPEFLDFRNKKKASSEEKNASDILPDIGTPDESMETGYAKSYESLKQSILLKILSNDPALFEKLVVRLLEKMGYGTGKVTGKTGDGGVDGFIDQDELGLEKVYLQAKRFSEGVSVTASMVRDFIGTLEMNKAEKGVFITTSKFPKDASENVKKARKHIALIDGEILVELMIKHNVGVTTKRTYEIKQLDEEYFDEL